MPRVASGSSRDRSAEQEITKTRMNAASKDTNSNTPGLQKNVAGKPAGDAAQSTASQPDSQAKPPLPETKAKFGQATFYRQGVLVPGGPHKSPTPRSKNR